MTETPGCLAAFLQRMTLAVISSGPGTALAVAAAAILLLEALPWRRALAAAPAGVAVAKPADPGLGAAACLTARMHMYVWRLH